MNEPKRTMHLVVLAVCGLLLLAALPFIAILASVLEEYLYGTSYIQSACTKIGVHDFISRIFETFFLN
jgi:hypothetical protein